MKLPSQKKILKEDLKDVPAGLNPLIDTLNSFMETIYQMANKNITFQDNIASFVKEVTYKTDSVYPAAQKPISFQNTLKNKPMGLQVIQVYDKSNYVPAAGPVYAPWVENGGEIVINTITGLEPNKSYLIRFLVF